MTYRRGIRYIDKWCIYYRWCWMYIYYLCSSIA